MKIVVCDQCDKRVQAEGMFASPPKGWTTISENGDDLKDKHLCSGECVIAYGEALRADVAALVVQEVAKEADAGNDIPY